MNHRLIAACIAAVLGAAGPARAFNTTELYFECEAKSPQSSASIRVVQHFNDTTGSTWEARAQASSHGYRYDSGLLPVKRTHASDHSLTIWHNAELGFRLYLHRVERDGQKNITRIDAKATFLNVDSPGGDGTIARQWLDCKKPN